MNSVLSMMRFLSVCLLIGVVACQDTSVPGPLSGPSAPATRENLGLAVAPELELRFADAVSLSLAALPGRYRVLRTELFGRRFSVLECPNCGVTNEIGRPQLPVVRRFVEAPAGTRPVVEFAARSRKISALSEEVLPVQPSVPKLPGAFERAVFARDEELYARDEFYPADDASVSGPLMVRGHHLYLVEYHPFRYNPARREVQTTLEGSLALRFVPADLPSAVDPVMAASPAFDAWLSRNVLNARPATRSKGSSTQKYAEGILIIAGTAYAGDPGLAAYVELRRAEGHRVELVSMANVGGSTPAAVRAYIRTQYLSWNEPALSHVVLVGDTTDVPIYTGSGGGESQVTDNYYAAIDPDNYTADLLAPDLLVSRISVNNATELSTYLARATNYLWATFPTTTAWMTKFSFLASCDNSNITEGTHNYVINTYTAPRGYTGTYPANPQAGGDRLYCSAGGLTETVIKNALHDGRLVINMSGHGDETYWADPSFTQTYLNQVTPPDAAPYVISNACLTGTFGRSGGDCWGEMWLNKTQGGAILFYGASNLTYWTEDDILEKKLWDGVFASNITRFSAIDKNAKLQTLAHFGPVDRMAYYFEEYNSLGDGSLDLYTDAPFTATVLYPQQLPLGLDTVDVSVMNGGTPVAGALVSLRGLGVQQVGYTDAAGQVTLIMNPLPADVGDLTLTVTGHNLRRQANTIQVIPASGPYLSRQSHEVTSDGTTPVPPTPGRHIVLPITVKNVGTVAATGISATLSTTGSAATITQAQPVFPVVAPGASARSTTHAEFDINPAAMDGTLIELQLAWSTAEGASGVSRFGVSVQRPRFVFSTHAVDDALAGCDADGIPDANEAATFRLTLENQGSADAHNVTVSLAAPDCTQVAPASFGMVAAGQTVIAPVVVRGDPTLACPAEDVPFTVRVSADELPAPDTDSFSQDMNADLAADQFFDDMEGTPPNGWTHGASSGSDDWAYVTTSSHSPTHAWFCSDPAATSDKWLRTPSVTIGAAASLQFWHRMDSESGYDGGRVEISTDGGQSFTDLGSRISENGYNDTISGGSAWSGTIAWQRVTADLAGFGPGPIMIRFHFTSDSSISETGWWIDDVRVDTQSLVCQQLACGGGNRPPVANAGPDQHVIAGAAVTLDGSQSRDPDADPITFAWAQVDGPAVSLTGADTAQPTFTAPVLPGETTLTFELTVADAEESATDQVSIFVHNCDDGNSCTSDQFTGTSCTHTVLADCSLCGSDGVCVGGTCIAGGQQNPPSCDDGDACTQTDLCLGGACAGTNPVVCEPLDSCHIAGTCNPVTGQCSNPTRPENSPCDDGNACTRNDLCRSGVCRGYAPVQCTALDACHVAGTCDPATGECSNPPAEDGIPCDDGSACTRSDSCQQGVCTGADPVVCQAQDQCHPAGTCDPATGQCSQPVAENGTTCDDGDACTQSDTCQQGVCTGANPVVCQAQDQCHVAGACDPATGACSNPPAADGTSCDDGAACTQTDACAAGVCQGSDRKSCPASDECHMEGTCDPMTGACSNPPAIDGTKCSTGTCQDGVCQEESSSGCGCATGNGGASGLALGLGLLLALRRRRAVG
jgi:MYXO-CTERM domain-containing protein